jgi:hypothetical protein
MLLSRSGSAGRLDPLGGQRRQSRRKGVSLSTCASNCATPSSKTDCINPIAVVLQRECGCPPSALAARCRHSRQRTSRPPLADGGMARPWCSNTPAMRCFQRTPGVEPGPRPWWGRAQPRALSACLREHTAPRGAGVSRQLVKERSQHVHLMGLATVCPYRTRAKQKRPGFLCRDPGLEGFECEGCAPTRCPCPGTTNPHDPACRMNAGFRTGIDS